MAAPNEALAGHAFGITAQFGQVAHAPMQVPMWRELKPELPAYEQEDALRLSDGLSYIASRGNESEGTSFLVFLFFER